MTTKITLDNISPGTLVALQGVKITTVAYSGSATAANLGGNETIAVTGTGFNSNTVVYVDTTSCATTYVSATSLSFTSPAKSVGSYHLYVYNTDGSTGILPGGITYSAIPVWVTASGALDNGAINNAYSRSVSATGDGTITYSLTSGSLPTGLSLNTSTGAITGTPTVEATSNFTITATDSQNQTASRSFSISVISVVSSVQYLVVAGGGGGGRRAGGGGGAGGFITGNYSNIILGITYTVTVGAGGTGSTSDYGNAGSGLSSNVTYGSNIVLTTVGGGGGGSALQTSAAGPGGSGGGGGDGEGGFPAGGTGTPGQGNPGGAGFQGGAYSGGGGGGAGIGGTGGAAPPSGGGSGGFAANTSITGDIVFYAGGGGGGSAFGPGGSVNPASGGGGAGIEGGSSTAGTNATQNLGGGGGGSGAAASPLAPGGNGGSGIVVIRYPNVFANATVTGSPNVIYANANIIYKFWQSGTIIFN